MRCGGQGCEQEHQRNEDRVQREQCGRRSRRGLRLGARPGRVEGKTRADVQAEEHGQQRHLADEQGVFATAGVAQHARHQRAGREEQEQVGRLDEKRMINTSS